MAHTMTIDEIRAFLLSGTRTGKLATVRADGRPHIAPVWFVLDDADNQWGFDLLFNTAAMSVKGRNIARDPRIALTIDDERPPFAYVLVEGIAETSDDLDAMLPWSMAIGRRYMGAERGDQFGRRNATAGELLVRLRPSRVLAEADIVD